MMYCGYQWWQKRKHQPRESTHLRPDKIAATILADHGIIERTVSRASSRRPIMTHPQVREYYDYHGAEPEAMTKRMCSGADINREAGNADHAATSTTHAVPVDPNKSDTEDDNEIPPKRKTTVARSSRMVNEVADVKSKERGEALVAIANAQQDTSGVEAPSTPVEEPNNAHVIGATAPTDHLYDLGGARVPPLGGNSDEDLQEDVPINRIPVANMLPIVAPVYRDIGREEILQNRILLLEQQMVDMQRFHLASTQLQQMQANQTQAELLNTKQELINTKRELENTKGVLKHEQRKSRRLELASLPPLMPPQGPDTGNKRSRTQS
jgi:hypothetical protein